MSITEDTETIRTLFHQQHGFVMSRIMFTACELGIFDLLLESEEPLSSATIAERLGISPTGAERLLETCVSLKLLRMERKDGEGLYCNTTLANLYLAKQGPKSQHRYLKFQSEVVYSTLQHLTDIVREGKGLFKKTYGMLPNSIFDGHYRSGEDLQRFSYAMDDAWHLYGKEVMSVFDLSYFPLIYDLGGDFFKGPIPEADLYIMARILQDWDDEKCMQLLTKLHKACRPGGGVLVVELLLDEDRCGPFEVQLHSILLLVLMEGKQRTGSEYKALFTAAGFKEFQCKKGRHYSTMLGRK